MGAIRLDLLRVGQRHVFESIKDMTLNTRLNPTKDVEVKYGNFRRVLCIELHITIGFIAEMQS